MVLDRKTPANLPQAFPEHPVNQPVLFCIPTQHKYLIMPQILVIEPDPFICDTLVQALKRHNYFARFAISGAKALEQLRAYPADLVITDMLMTDIDGVEIIRTLRREFPDTKIIAISAGGLMTARDYLRIASVLGAHKTFAKPFLFNEMLQGVSELLHPPQEDAAPEIAP